MAKLKVIPVYDLEAVNWTKPIAAGFFDGYKYYEFIRKDEEDDVIWRFLSFLQDNFAGGKVYAHCAAGYDNKLLLSSLCNHNEAVMLEAGLAKLRWIGPNITFEDSYLLVPFPLKKLTKMFGAPEKKEWEHEKNLEPWEMGAELSTFKEYMERDCVSLSNTLDKVSLLLSTTLGIFPSISLSATSVKAFSKGFSKVDDIEANEQFESFIREATYGGRNEVYKRYGENINQYDIKSMYVSCYDTPLPIGKMSWSKGNLDKGGLAEAYCKVPKDWYIGPLPLRYKGRLVFPVGELPLGWWDTRELKNAAEMGVDITIRRQLICDEIPILTEFGKTIGSLRGGATDEFWKMFGLAIVGKLGQGRWRDTVRHFMEIEDFSGWAPIDKEELYFQSKEYLKNHPYIKPALSMRIRAEARIRHLQVILKAAEGGEIFYGDTDSIFTTVNMTQTEGIGGLIYLGKAERGYFIKQKLYALVEKGRMRQRSAGFSDLKLTEEDFQGFLEGKEILVDSTDLTSYKNILKTKDVKLLETRSVLFGKASDSRVGCGYDSSPICLPELPSKFSSFTKES